MRVKYEYGRSGLSYYVAATDLHQSRLFDCCGWNMVVLISRCLSPTQISQSPCNKPHLAFCIVCNKSLYRGFKAVSQVSEEHNKITYTTLFMGNRTS